MENPRRHECALRISIGRQVTCRLSVVRPRWPWACRGGSQVHQHPRADRGGTGEALRRIGGRALRVPGQRPRGLVLGLPARGASASGGYLLFTSRLGTPYRRGAGASQRAGCADRSPHRRARLPDCLHQHAVRGHGAWPAQAVGRDGDWHRQDAYCGGVDQAPVRRQHDHARIISGRPHHAGEPSRGYFHRLSAGVAVLCAARRAAV